jgi:hypothetical protein
MYLKWSIVVVSFCALACAVIAWLSGSDVRDSDNVFLLAFLFAFAVGILSTVNARRLQHYYWSFAWGFLTVGGVIIFCGSFVGEGLSDPSWAGSLSPEAPDLVQQFHLVMFVPTVVLSLVAVLCALLLRRSQAGPGKPVDPSAGAL